MNVNVHFRGKQGEIGGLTPEKGFSDGPGLDAALWRSGEVHLDEAI